MHVKIMRYKPYEKNTMRGFLDVAVEETIVIPGCIHNENEKGTWIGMPSTKGKDGKYRDLVRFTSKDRFWAFQNAMREELVRYFRDHKEDAPQDDIPF